MKNLLLAAAVLAGAIAVPAGAVSIPGKADFDPSWVHAVKPFQISGNVYYVGTQGLAAYLITANHRAILLDGTLPQNAPLIERNIKALGFKLSDVKIILNSHAHFDHAGAIAQLKRDTGAVFYASPGDRWALEHGTHDGQTTYPRGHFPAVKVDRVLRDGEVVALGGVRMKATFTPGHTRGCTTWSTAVIVPGKVLNVVFPCSVTVAGNVLVGNRVYPRIVADYRKSFDTLDAMPADIVLTNHPDAADVIDREARQERGDKTAFIDPKLLRQIADDARADFGKQLMAAQAKSRDAPPKSS